MYWNLKKSTRVLITILLALVMLIAMIPLLAAADIKEIEEIVVFEYPDVPLSELPQTGLSNLYHSIALFGIIAITLGTAVLIIIDRSHRRADEDEH